MGRSRGFWKERLGLSQDPSLRSCGAVGVWKVLVEPTCIPAGGYAQVCVSVAAWGWRPRLWLLRVCALVCWGCQCLGPNSVIPGAAVVGGASCGGVGGAAGRRWLARTACEQGDRKNIRRRPSRAALQRGPAGARGEEVSVFRPLALR